MRARLARFVRVGKPVSLLKRGGVYLSFKLCNACHKRLPERGRADTTHKIATRPHLTTHWSSASILLHLVLLNRRHCNVIPAWYTTTVVTQHCPLEREREGEREEDKTSWLRNWLGTDFA